MPARDWFAVAFTLEQFKKRYKAEFGHKLK